MRGLLASQKEKLHGGGVGDQVGTGLGSALYCNLYCAGQGGSVLSAVFEKFVLAMVLYFIVSIVNSLAQSNQQRRAVQETSAQSEPARVHTD